MGSRDTNLVPDFRNYRHLMENFPRVTKPKVMGAFSVDKHGECHGNLDQLKYLHIPEGTVHWDLNSGYETYQEKPPNVKDTNIHHILQFIQGNWQKMQVPKDHPISRQRVIFPEIVCFRGLLRLIMCTPYESRQRDDGWIILATKYRGTIYLCERDTPEKEEYRRNTPPDMKKFCYYGYKFEQYIMTKELNKPHDLTEPVIQAEEMGVAFKADIDHHRILYVAEVDGIKSNVSIDRNADLSRIPVEFVEVKTKKKAERENQRRNFRRFTLRNWWCQSFLAGIENVYMGVRNSQGVVEAVERIPVRDMPKQGADDWSSAICMKFCIIFLDMVKFYMENLDDPNTVIKFSFNPRFNDHIEYEKFSGNSPLSFIPEWYIEFLRLRSSG